MKLYAKVGSLYPRYITPLPRTIHHALGELFGSQTDFEVCGEAENGQEAIEKAERLRPDLIVMDLSMPVMNGIEAARVLKRLAPAAPLIIFSEYSDVFSEQEARSAGVRTRFKV